MNPSKLCWADKSILYDPAWFYLLRAKMSGELDEYKKNSPEDINSCSDLEWVNWLKKQQLVQSTSKVNSTFANEIKKYIKGEI